MIAHARRLVRRFKQTPFYRSRAAGWLGAGALATGAAYRFFDKLRPLHGESRAKMAATAAMVGAPFVAGAGLEYGLHRMRARQGEQWRHRAKRRKR